MTIKKAFTVSALAAASLFAAPLAAHDDANMISAKDPSGMAEALRNAGYEVELGTDSVGDPKITVILAGMSTGILFYGCDEETNDNCDSVQFNTGFDSEEPWTAKQALELSGQYRFISVSLDDEGDPFISWDVVTGDGIPVRVFMVSVREFANANNVVAAIAFDE